MQNYSTLDVDEQALIKKQRPIGWFVAGLVGIGALGFVVAKYLPLSAAHDTLVKEHAALAKKAGELSHGLTDVREQLTSAEKERGELRGKADGIEKAAAADSALFERSAGTVSSQLDKFVKAKIVTVASSTEQFRVGFDVAKLFVGPTSKLAPAYTKPLCSATESVARPGDLGLSIVVPVLAADDAKAWALAGERAAQLAYTLSSVCKIAPERLTAGAGSSVKAVELTVRHGQS